MKKLILFVFSLSIINYAFVQTYSTIFIHNEKKIDSILRSVYKDSLPGISIGIMYNGNKVFNNSYGIGNIQTKEKLTTSSNFNICSLTKQFTAVAILQLEEKKLLSFNDKISRFFPDMNKKVADVITVQQLLTHTSGLIDHYDFVNTTNMHHAHNIDVYNAIKNLYSTYFIPGAKFRYSNTAYCLLALIIEKLSGLNYDEYMMQNIFKPAGMNNTIIWNEKAAISKEVTGYSFDSSTSAFNKSGADEHIFFSTEGDGGIYTSVHDYEQWFKALQSGKLCSKYLINRARSVQYLIDTAHKTGYGYGWFVDENQTIKKVYHSGDNGGFRTYSFTIPDENFMIVIFSNRDDVNIENIVQQIVKLLLPQYSSFTPVEALTS